MIKKTEKRNAKNIKMFCVEAIHFLLTCGLFYGAWLIFRYDVFPQTKDIGFRYNYFVTFGFAILLTFFNHTYNSYLFGYSRIRTIALAQFFSQLFSEGIIYFAVSLAWNRFCSPFMFLLLLLCYALLDIVCAIFGNYYFFYLNPSRTTILIYRNKIDRKRFGMLKGKPIERLYTLVKEIEFDGEFEEIKSMISGYDAIFVAGLNSRCRNCIMKYCEENNIIGFFLPHIGDVIMQGAEHIQSFDSPVMIVMRKQLKLEYRVFKRCFDLICASVGIVVFSPVFLITAVAIKSYDRGPVFYKQVRLTKDGEKFNIVKFRSMRADAENDGVARLSTGKNDSRITPIGRILRKYRIDELPQLWNILVGEMSFVGPRPERPEIAEQYCKIMPDFQLRLQVKAGLTGYAQIYGKYNIDPYEKLEFDLMYINSMSLFTDLELLFATFGTLFSSQSTEGIEVGQTTAITNDYMENQPLEHK